MGVKTHDFANTCPTIPNYGNTQGLIDVISITTPDSPEHTDRRRHASQTRKHRLGDSASLKWGAVAEPDGADSPDGTDGQGRQRLTALLPPTRERLLSFKPKVFSPLLPVVPDVLL